MILDLDEFRLPESVLRQYAIQVTGLREKQRKLALKVEDSMIQKGNAEVQQISKLATKMLKGRWDTKFQIRKAFLYSEPSEETSPSMRKRRKQRMLTLDQKVDAVWRIQVQKEPWKDVARLNRVSLAVVAKLMGKVKKDPSFLGDLIS